MRIIEAGDLLATTDRAVILVAAGSATWNKRYGDHAHFLVLTCGSWMSVEAGGIALLSAPGADAIMDRLA